MQSQTEPLGDLLKRHRQAAGLTQEELAERAGLSARGIKALEGSKRIRPHKDTLRLLSYALALSPAEQQALQEAVRQARGPAAHGQPSERAVPGTSLPVPLSSFVGREREVAAVVDRVVRPSVRLLTLTGPGGVGKTRLALQVAACVQDRFADGVLFLPLASLADPALVPSAVARLVGVQERGAQPLTEDLIAVLRHRHLLLLLDNFEHLLAVSALVAQLVAAAPALHLLITSRTPLHLTGEHEFAVPPLTLPETHQFPSVETIAQSEAVMLYVARAQAVMADFRLMNENAPAVAEICRRLDGLPLAIELAGARTKLFPPAALLDRLSPSLPLLTGGPHDLPARLQTVRGTIDWSYSLLGMREQRLFARLAVFASGGTTEAVEAVCDLEGDGDLLEPLTVLVDQSLVRREGEEEPRVVLLATIQEYASERLLQRGEGELLRERHAHWYLVQAQEAAQAVARPQQPAWLERLERDHDNLRAVLQWAQDTGRPELGLQLAIALSRFWQIQGYLVEGHTWLTRLLALGGDDVPSVLRAHALSAFGELLFAQGQTREASAVFEESMTLLQDLGDLEGSMEVLDRLSHAFLDQGNHARTIELLTEHVTLYRERGEQRLLAWSLCLLASHAIWYRGTGDGDAAQARVLGEESLAIYRELDDIRGTLYALGIVAAAAYEQGDLVHARVWTDELLALLPGSSPEEVHNWTENPPLVWAARDRGDYGRAVRLMETVEDRARALGDTRSAAMARQPLSVLAREQGNYDRARSLARECLAVFQQAHDRLQTGWALLSLADVARDQGDPVPMLELAGQALALFRESGSTCAAGIALNSLGLAARYQGDYERAEALLSESVSLCQEGGLKPAEVLVSLGLVALEQAQYERAHQVLVESLRAARTWLDGTVLEGLASVAIGQREAERAARLFGAAETIRRTKGTPRWPADEALYQKHVALTRAAMEEEPFARIWEEGQAMPTDAAIAYALNQARDDCTKSTRGTGRTGECPLSRGGAGGTAE